MILRRVHFPPQIVVYAVVGDMPDYAYPANSLEDLQGLLDALVRSLRIVMP